MKIRKSAFAEGVFWTALLFCTLYSAYRYPLKMGTTTTSPTYSDTPVVIQAAKFVVVLALCLLVGFLALVRPIRARRVAMLVALIFLQLFVLVKAMYAFDVEFINQSFWALAAIVLVVSVRKIESRKLDSFLLFLFWFSVLTDGLQVLLFIVFRRLPAQGYPDSIVVRFGGWLDAPNDFACLLFLLMGWGFFRFRGMRRVLVQASLAACLLLTQSLTAYAFFALLLLLLGLRQALRRPIYLVCLIALLVAFFAVTHTWIVDLFQNLMENKTGSIQGHLQSPDKWLGQWSEWVFWGAPDHIFLEDWWFGSLLNLGVAWLCACLTTMAALIFVLFMRLRRALDLRDRSVLAGILLFSLYCLAGSLNLPLLTYFPVNFMFYAFLCLVFFDKIEYASAAAQPSVALPSPVTWQQSRPSEGSG
jgi:hypothetical protein